MNQYKEILKYSIDGYSYGNLERSTVIRGSASIIVGDLFRGLALDRINITSNLFTKEDCDNLINFLKITKYCLPYKPPID